MNGTEALTVALERLGVGYELLEHQRTDRAADEAAALGLPASEIAKTIVVTTGQDNVRVLLPASERIDMHKLRDLLDAGKELHLLSEDALERDYPEFELGAVAPVGGREDSVVVDQRLAALESVVFEAGAHEHSARVKTAAFVAGAGARVADVCVDRGSARET